MITITELFYSPALSPLCAEPLCLNRHPGGFWEVISLADARQLQRWMAHAPEQFEGFQVRIPLAPDAKSF